MSFSDTLRAALALYNDEILKLTQHGKELLDQTSGLALEKRICPVFLVLVAVLVFVMLQSSTPASMNNGKQIQRNDVSKALLSIFVPTHGQPHARSILEHIPFTLRSSFKPGSKQKETIASIRLTTLLRAIRRGAIELRDPADLGLLIAGKMEVCAGTEVDAVRVRVTLDADQTRWICEVSGWLLSSRMCGRREVKYDPELCNTSKTFSDLSSVQDIPRLRNILLSSLSQPASTSIDLDFVAPQHLSSALTAFLSSLLVSQKPITATVSFTALTCHPAPPRFPSTAFVLCALPLLPTHQLASSNQNRWTRTPTPLFLTLPSVLSLLSASSTTKIASITNTTLLYASTLLDAEDVLVEDTKLRTLFVDRWGVEKWREMRFWQGWEAGLLSEGFAERWKVVLAVAPSAQ